MPYAVGKQRNRRKTRRVINLHQNKFDKGYISTIDNSRRPLTSLSDMTNMEIVQDSIARPRPPLIRYGTQPDKTVIGRANVRYDGSRSIYWMMNDAGTGKLYKQVDGEEFTVLADADNSYDETAWAMGVQSKAKLYIYNGVNNLSYVDLTDDSIVKYTALSTPGAPTPTKTGMSGSTVTHYYRISAINEVGESIASTAGSVQSSKYRGAWIENTDYITVTWSAVTNATGYVVYYGTSATNCYELFVTDGNGATTFVDYGTLATNTFKLAPEGNSTQGAVFTWMYADSSTSQIFGVTADNYLYYSAPGTGDFSPFNGGGYVGIDVDGDTQLNFVDGFRNGKGDPVITVSARGAAGKGKLFHVSFDEITIGDQIIIYPNVYEANGQSGTYAPRATIKARDSLFYPTGQDFRSTGTSQNIVNILTTNTVSQVIEPDVERIKLDALNNAVGLEYRDKLYFALPVGSSSNNEIWYMDLARKNLWVLRWPIAVKDMWLYEDNSGSTHFCVLSDNKILEFTRAGARTHQDDDEAWESRVAFESLVWDEDGLSLGSIRNMYFKLLFPKGTINASATGLTRRATETAVGSDNFTTTTTATGIGQWQYGGAFLPEDAAYMYGDDPGEVDSYGKSVAVLRIRPKGLLNQLDWEVTANTLGTDYFLSAINSRGYAIDQLTLKTESQ